MSAVEDVKQRIDIVDLISQHVTLKKSGRGYVAPCPFHTERTPSFHVDPSRQTWHCFGACGTGGDIFAFVMKKDGVEFRDALRMLAERAGVTLESRRDSQQDARRARLFEINEAAAAFFHERLRSSDDEGAVAARAYVGERHVSQDAVTTFQLGYAPNSWDALSSHLASRGYGERDVRDAGLALEGERGAYDRFRHRLMFPIRDDRGRVAGFGGRLLPGESVGSGGVQPKYVNTPQSPIFDKGAILYALDLAKDAIRSEGRAVIVEGYMDAIAAHEHGFSNVIASMGTALTERQVGLLKRYTRNLVLALDADTAGSEATLRGVQVVADSVDRERTPVPNWRGIIRQQETLAADIRVLSMPAGLDPDDVIRGDPEGWRTLVESASPVLDHLFEAMAAKHDLSIPRERSALAGELLPLIAAVPDRIVQSHYVQRLARLTRVDEATLRLDMRQPARARGGDDPGTVPMQARDQRTRERREEFCLALLFRYPVLRAEGLGLGADLFGQIENRALFESWVECGDTGESFGQSVAQDLRPHYERIVTLDLPPYDDDAVVEALRSTVWNIEQQRLRNAKRVSAAVVSDLPPDDGPRIAERARSGWQSGTIDDDDADPAAAFVEDMKTGLKVHQRLLERQRRTSTPPGEVVNER